LLSRARSELLFPAGPIEDLDGRMLVIQPALLLESARAGGYGAGAFSRKYGPGPGAARLTRFRLVLEFLLESQAEISDAGLACSREPMMIREEFVRFLLNWHLEPRQRRIPRIALSRFLDEWGHRWI
jgi:hypothetical protein